MCNLSERQFQALRYIYDYQQAHKRSPSFRDISKAMSTPHSTGASCHIRILHNKGYIYVYGARAIKITEKGLEAIRLRERPVEPGTLEIALTIADYFDSPEWQVRYEPVGVSNER